PRRARGRGTRRRGDRRHGGRPDAGRGEPRRAGGGASCRLPGGGPATPQGLARCGDGGGARPARGRGGEGIQAVMLYALLYPLHASYAPLNVFRYITFRTLLAGLTALTISLLLGPRLIKRLVALQIGQSIRSDGPAAHATKAGTPTMGGTLIIFALLLSTLLLADLTDWYVWVAMFVTLGHGLIGFADDWAKVRRRNSA